jgi:hypothetical protein
MLKRLLTFGLALCFTSLMYAQDGPTRTCAANELYVQQNNNSKTALNRQMIEEHTRVFLDKKAKGTANARTGILTIPIIVHVLYNTAQENISDAQVQSQIDVLNEDFRKLNSDAASTPAEFTPVDTEIQFTLSYINRKSTTKTSWGTNDAMKKLSQGGIDPVDPANNLNMWICNIGGGILGYAQFPGGPAATDGVVFSPQYCGSIDKQPVGQTFYLSAPFDKGRTATHEIGHYLNLRHIWGDGNCSADDFVSDTPLAAAPNYGCPAYPSKSCTSNGGFTSDMFMNYMDYSDDACMFMFSAGQKARMDAIFDPGGAREGLGTSTGGCALAAPTGLASSVIANTSFNLNWNAVTGAVSYTVTYGSLSATVTGTSYAVSGLTAGTPYTCNVKANCASGSGAASANVVVTTTGSNCKVGPVTLTLVTDGYASETSWSLSKNGTAVASNGALANNTTYNVSLDYGDGSYSFTINDSYGDGICCAYGNGSYTLKDASNTVIATGGAYGTGVTNTYCTTGGAAPDTQAPTTPGGLAASGITVSSANLSWTASTDNVGVTGYDVFANGTFKGSTTTTSFSVTGLTASTTYSMTVKAKDAAGNVSAASTGLNVTTLANTVTYCASKGNSVVDEWIQKVVFGTINNTSGSNGGYADFTTQSASINAGSNYTITITPAWSGTIYNEAYTVWIDYNQDGDFIDAGETVYSRAKSKVTPISGSFTVPTSALSGSTRMRVSMKYNANPTSCETFSYGEVEDYTVVIGGGARSVEELSSESAFAMYPNPANGQTTIHSVLSVGTDVNIVVFDAMGRSVYNNNVKAAPAGNFEHEINLGGMQKGLYYVVVKGQNLQETRKLLVK